LPRAHNNGKRKLGEGVFCKAMKSGGFSGGGAWGFRENGKPFNRA